MKKYKYEKKITIDGKRYSIRADTLEELGAKTALKRKEIEEGRVLVSGNMTVDQWAEICFSTYKSTSEKTKRDIIARYKNHVSPEIGSYKIRQIRPIQCQRILNSLEGKSDSFVHKMEQELKFLFKKAAKNKIILESPAEDLTIPASVKHGRRALTPYERKHFLRVCENTDKFILFELMLFCGCRPSEAIRCIGADITYINGYPMLHIRGTKTKSADRYVPVPDAIITRLQSVSRLAPLAPGYNGGVMTEGQYAARVKALKRALNVSMGCRVFRNALVPPYPLAPDFTPYNLRHTYCTDLQKAGVDVRTAQKLMGHSSIQMTVNIYTHVDNDSISDAARILGVTPVVTPTTATAVK